jgi:hypothetical protein
MTLDEFRARWEKRRDDYGRLPAQVNAASLIDQMLGELQDVNTSESAHLLTLTQAAALCGYSADHLGRLVRTGALFNYGRPHAPRIRLGDLPRRAGRRAGLGELTPTQYDPVTDARSLRGHHRPGGDHEPK